MTVVLLVLERLAAAGVVAVNADSRERISRATDAVATLLPGAWAH